MKSLLTNQLNRLQQATEKAGPDETKKTPWLVYIGILLVFVIFRIFAWSNTSLIEDNDGLYYLLDIKNFVNQGLVYFFDMHVDMTPFYPMWGALFSLPGWSVETGARLASFAFSIGLFFALVSIGRKIVSSKGVVFGLIILSIHAFFIPFSFSILTEPSYVAVAYIGLWLFWRQFKKPTPLNGLLLGIVFGLCFLNRTEGLLFIATIPAFQLVHYFFVREKNYNFKQLVVWSLLFVTSFGLLNLPQVMRVSNKLGFFAINGRQLWVLMLNNPDCKSPEQKIWGTDYSPADINILFVQKNPDVVKDLESSISLREYARTIKRNLKTLIKKRMTEMLGPLGFLFFGLGLLYLFSSRRYYELFLVSAFISSNLAGPFIHDVDMRHIAIIGPIMFLIQGVGIVYLSSLVLKLSRLGGRFQILQHGFPYAILLVAIASVAAPGWKSLHPPTFNYEYGVDELKGPLAFIKRDFNSPNRGPRIVARTAHVPFMSNGECYYIPYTDYEGLVRYCYLNDVDYLYFLHRRLKRYPFYEQFERGEIPEFQLVFSGTDAYDKETGLYKFDKKKYETLADGRAAGS